MLFLQGEQVILELRGIKLTLIDEVKFMYSSVFAFFISKEAVDNRPKYFQFIFKSFKVTGMCRISIVGEKGLFEMETRTRARTFPESNHGKQRGVHILPPMHNWWVRTDIPHLNQRYPFP